MRGTLRVGRYEVNRGVSVGRGRLDCAGAARWIAKTRYVKQRVFFADEETAIAAGYRPCARCTPEEYRGRRERTSGSGPTALRA